MSERSRRLGDLPDEQQKGPVACNLQKGPKDELENQRFFNLALIKEGVRGRALLDPTLVV